MFRALILSGRSRGLVALANAKKFHVSVPLMTCKKKGDYIPEGYHKIKLTQAKFQVDDGVPVFLKAGRRDVILYRTTLILAIIGPLCGIAMVIRLIAESIPPSQEQTFEQTSDKGPERDC